MTEEEILEIAKQALPKGVRSCYNKKQMIEMFKDGFTYATMYMANMIKQMKENNPKE